MHTSVESTLFQDKNYSILYKPISFVKEQNRASAACRIGQEGEGSILFLCCKHLRKSYREIRYEKKEEEKKKISLPHCLKI